MVDSHGASAWISDQVQYAGVEIRRDLSALLANGTTRPFGARSGRRPGAGGVPTVSGTTITIPAGVAVVDNGGSADGPFLVSWLNAPNLMQAPANSSNTRIDIVYVRVTETVAAGVTTQTIAFGVQAGAASSNPQVPTTLDDGTPVAQVAILGYLRVPASGGGNAVVTPGPEAVAAGGKRSVLNSTEYPPSPNTGEVVFDRTLGYTVEWNGTRWRRPNRWFAVGGALVGSVPADPEVREIAGQFSLATNANGDFTLALPQAFPNAILAVHLTLSATVSGASLVPYGSLNFTVNTTNTDLGNIRGRVFDPSTGQGLASAAAIPVSLSVRGC